MEGELGREEEWSNDVPKLGWSLRRFLIPRRANEGAHANSRDDQGEAAHPPVEPSGRGRIEEKEVGQAQRRHQGNCPIHPPKAVERRCPRIHDVMVSQVAGQLPLLPPSAWFLVTMRGAPRLTHSGLRHSASTHAHSA